ncbi:MFS transporter [Streptomyces tubbatahanensis]|uniref:MFS transporter n=1 Tax=Streptomyces tubbatahanensis TaxID=2923272 RepID=A0ABY3XM45_9ACTN|nr:MFS transporter [Streptomyces tubbatahanensis]UNS95501.1 MFS transporter [Streptomyces tubbatahanensis]
MSGTAPDGHESAHDQGHPRRWAILVAICAALLVIVVDNTVLNVALPSIAARFEASTAWQQAVLDAYTVVFSGLLITAGALSDRWGRRRAMVAGLVVLGLSSAAAALAWSVWWLVAMRALMGVGAALVMPATLALLVHVFPAHERPRAFAVWGVVASVAMAVGPVLGGALVALWSWTGAFLVNVPVACGAVVAIWRLVPESRDSSVRPVDPRSAAWITVGMVALTTGVILAGEGGPSQPAVLVAAPVALLAGAAFLRRQRRAAAPMVDLSLYRDRQFAGGSAAVTIISMGTGSTLFILAQYLQLVRGMDPLQAGLASAPMAAGVVLGSYAGGRAPARIGHRLSVIAGFTATAVGFLFLAALTPHGSYLLAAVGLFLVGGGNGFAGPAVTSTVLGAVPKDRAGLGSALNDTHQQFGVALGVALLGGLVAAVYRAGLPATVPGEARGALAATLDHSRGLPEGRGDALAAAARTAFTQAQTATMLAAAGCVTVGVVIAALVLRRDTGEDEGRAKRTGRPARRRRAERESA